MCERRDRHPLNHIFWCLCYTEQRSQEGTFSSLSSVFLPACLLFFPFFLVYLPPPHRQSVNQLLGKDIFMSFPNARDVECRGKLETKNSRGTELFSRTLGTMWPFYLALGHKPSISHRPNLGFLGSSPCCFS